MRTCSDCDHDEHEGRCGKVIELGAPGVVNGGGYEYATRGRATCGCTGNDEGSVDEGTEVDEEVQS